MQSSAVVSNAVKRWRRNKRRGGREGGEGQERRERKASREEVGGRASRKKEPVLTSKKRPRPCPAWGFGWRQEPKADLFGHLVVHLLSSPLCISLIFTVFLLTPLDHSVSNATSMHCV